MHIKKPPDKSVAFNKKNDNKIKNSNIKKCELFESINYILKK